MDDDLCIVSRDQLELRQAAVCKITKKNSNVLPQNSMFQNFYLVRSCKIFLETHICSQKLKILECNFKQLKLSDLSSTLGLQSDVKQNPDLLTPTVWLESVPFRTHFELHHSTLTDLQNAKTGKSLHSSSSFTSQKSPGSKISIKAGRQADARKTGRKIKSLSLSCHLTSRVTVTS